MEDKSNFDKWSEKVTYLEAAKINIYDSMVQEQKDDI